jgi:hypothetical protein
VPQQHALSQPVSPVTQPGLSRRGLFGLGGLGAIQFFWANWLRADAVRPAPASERKAKSVILIFNCGAPSHVDLWDTKPLAPDNVRGEFQPVATKVPGIQISELLPGLARQADKYSIVRSVHP